MIDLDIANGEDRPVLEHMLQCSMLAARHRCWVTKYTEFGPAGGNPCVHIVGKDEDLWEFLIDPYTYGVTNVLAETSADDKLPITEKCIVTVSRSAWIYAKDMEEEAKLVFSVRQPAVWDDGRFEVVLGCNVAKKPFVTSIESFPKMVKANLSVVSYANGFSVWHYLSTEDTVANMLADGYFNEAKDMLRAGDMMYLVARYEGTAITKLAYVMVNQPEKLSISLMP